MSHLFPAYPGEKAAAVRALALEAAAQHEPRAAALSAPPLDELQAAVTKRDLGFTGMTHRDLGFTGMTRTLP